MLQHRPIQIAVFLLIVMVLFLISNHNKTLALEKELVQINKELHLIQVTADRRQKTYNEQRKLQHAKTERMIKEIN